MLLCCVGQCGRLRTSCSSEAYSASSQSTESVWRSIDAISVLTSWESILSVSILTRR